LTPGERWAIGEFPALAADHGFGEKSVATPAYNCIAFAAGDYRRWWWPIQALGRKMYWPDSAPRELTISAFVRAFESLGFRKCRNGKWRRGVEKIAIYVTANVPTHAAVQTTQGLWKSKLGSGIDVEHANVGSLAEYGTVAVYMKRRTSGVLHRLFTRR
jgi:hypothetical protein